MMRIFKNKAFHQWAIGKKIKNSTLIKIIEEMEQGLYEANLGGGVYKKRVPIIGRGKRSGARTIVAFKLHKTAFFMYGFSKSEKDTIANKEKEALKTLAKIYFSYSQEHLEQAIKSEKLMEITR